MATPRRTQGAGGRSAVTPPEAAGTNWDWLQTDPAEHTSRRKTRASRTTTRSAASPPTPSRSYANLRPSEVGPPDSPLLMELTPGMFIPSRPAPLPPTTARSPSTAGAFGRATSPTPAAPASTHPTRPASPAAQRPGLSSTLRALAGAAQVALAPVVSPTGSTRLRTSKSLHNLAHGTAPEPPRATNFLATRTSPSYASLTSASIQLHNASHRLGYPSQPAHPWAAAGRPASPSVHRPPSKRTLRGESSESSYSPSPASEETTGTVQSAWTDPPSPLLGWL